MKPQIRHATTTPSDFQLETSTDTPESPRLHGHRGLLTSFLCHGLVFGALSLIGWETAETRSLLITAEQVGSKTPIEPSILHFVQLEPPSFRSVPSPQVPEELEIESLGELTTDDFEDLVSTSDVAVDRFGMDRSAQLVSAGGGAGLKRIPDTSSESQPRSVDQESGDEEFEKKIQLAKDNGLEIVIVFDSTASMISEINSVKAHIRRIGWLVRQKISSARFSLVTYRDTGDAYVAIGMSLDHDLARIEQFIYQVAAVGGGDLPEAVDAGMAWAIGQNDFRPAAAKVMLIFGDAPPHRDRFLQCLQMAKSFRSFQNAKVTTVTCKRAVPLPEFYQIARAGGGESVTLANTERLMEDLLVLTFGKRHQQQVVEFFELRR